MRIRGLGPISLMMVAAAIGLAACDEAEQDRILRYEKGTYLGVPDEPLDNETLDDLRFRARLQAGG